MSAVDFAYLDLIAKLTQWTPGERTYVHAVLPEVLALAKTASEMNEIRSLAKNARRYEDGCKHGSGEHLTAMQAVVDAVNRLELVGVGQKREDAHEPR